jgi:hypothetical protein
MPAVNADACGRAATAHASSAPYFFPGSRAPSGVGVSPTDATTSINPRAHHRNTHRTQPAPILIPPGVPRHAGASVLFSNAHDPNVIQRFLGADTPVLRVHRHRAPREYRQPRPIGVEGAPTDPTLFTNTDLRGDMCNGSTGLDHQAGSLLPELRGVLPTLARHTDNLPAGPAVPVRYPPSGVNPRFGRYSLPAHQPNGRRRPSRLGGRWLRYRTPVRKSPKSPGRRELWQGPMPSSDHAGLRCANRRQPRRAHRLVGTLPRTAAAQSSEGHAASRDTPVENRQDAPPGFTPSVSMTRARRRASLASAVQMAPQRHTCSHTATAEPHCSTSAAIVDQAVFACCLPSSAGNSSSKTRAQRVPRRRAIHQGHQAKAGQHHPAHVWTSVPPLGSAEQLKQTVRTRFRYQVSAAGTSGRLRSVRLRRAVTINWPRRQVKCRVKCRVNRKTYPRNIWE